MPNIIQTPGAEPDPAHVATVTHLAAGLLGAIGSTEKPHGVQLDALLSAYGSLLLRHPGCWEGASWGLREFANKLDAMRMAQAAQADQLAAAAIATAAGKAA